MKKIYEELSRIQQELKAPKNLYNKFGSYYYRNAEGILEAVKPLIKGLVMIINDEPVVIGDRVYIKATVTLTDGEESVSAVGYAREDEQKKGMDGCQITGACSSYARKYALNALLMIDDNKDSDDDSLSPKNPENAEPDAKESTKRKNGPEQGGNRARTATVTTQAKVPAPAQNVPEQAGNQQETPAAYIRRMIAEFKKMDAGFDFIKARAGLIEGGVIKDIPSATMTLDQAYQLMEAVYVNCVQKAG